METVGFVAWIIPGFFVVWSFEKGRVDAQPDSWRLLLPAATVSLILYVFARILVIAGKLLAIEPCLGHMLRSAVSGFRSMFPLPNSLEFGLSLTLALLLANQVSIWGAVYKKKEERKKLSKIVRESFDFFGASDFDSNLQARLTDLVGQEVIVVLVSGRIYRAVLHSHDTITDESITIRPLWSGGRQTQGTVVFDTMYPTKKHVEMAGFEWNENDYVLTILTSQIQSVSWFNKFVNEWFVEQGKTIYQPINRPKSITLP